MGERWFLGGIGDATGGEWNYDLFGLDAWETYSADMTSEIVQFSNDFVGENRTIAAYCSSTSEGGGGGGSTICADLDSFAIAARTMHKGTGVGLSQNDALYDSRLTATAVNDWVRSGLQGPEYEVLSPGQQAGVEAASCPPSGPGGGGECDPAESQNDHTQCLEDKLELSKNISCLTGLVVNEPMLMCLDDCDATDIDNCRSNCVSETAPDLCYSSCFEEWATCCAGDSALSPPWKCTSLFQESDDPDVVNGDVCSIELATCIHQSLYGLVSEAPSAAPIQLPAPSNQPSGPPTDKCGNIMKRKKCKKTEGCDWENGKCIEVSECGGITSKVECRNKKNCWWFKKIGAKKKKCHVAPTTSECKNKKGKKNCLLLGCKWKKQKRSVQEDGASDSEL